MNRRATRRMQVPRRGIQDKPGPNRQAEEGKSARTHRRTETAKTTPRKGEPAANRVDTPAAAHRWADENRQESPRRARR